MNFILLFIDIQILFNILFILSFQIINFVHFRFFHVSHLKEQVFYGFVFQSKVVRQVWLFFSLTFKITPWLGSNYSLAFLFLENGFRRSCLHNHHVQNLMFRFWIGNIHFNIFNDLFFFLNISNFFNLRLKVAYFNVLPSILLLKIRYLFIQSFNLLLETNYLINFILVIYIKRFQLFFKFFNLSF